MEAKLSTFIGMYRYSNTFYTGTEVQPDALSIFVKKDKNESSLFIYDAEPLANICGKAIPVIGSFTGVLRVIKSVKAIFERLSNENSSGTPAIWLSMKNLFRAIAEACPFSGIFLIG